MAPAPAQGSMDMTKCYEVDGSISKENKVFRVLLRGEHQVIAGLSPPGLMKEYQEELVAAMMDAKKQPTGGLELAGDGDMVGVLAEVLNEKQMSGGIGLVRRDHCWKQHTASSLSIVSSLERQQQHAVALLEVREWKVGQMCRDYKGILQAANWSDSHVLA